MKFVTLSDGVRVEVDDQDGSRVSDSPVSDTTLDSIRPILSSVANSVSGAWQALGRHVVVDSAEIELGLAVKGQAGWIIAKAETSANLKIKITLKNPKVPAAENIQNGAAKPSEDESDGSEDKNSSESKEV